MTDWVRLWHDMPTDPKWRVIARKSGQPIAAVIAVYTFALVNASANATERGRTHNLNAEDIAAALDMDEQQIEAIITAMQGKVFDGDRLTGWEKRQPLREDGAAERARAWRERNRTQANAPERSDAETDTDKIEPPIPPVGGFDEFWNLYPHKIGEEAARRAYLDAEKSATAEQINAGAKRYVQTKPPEVKWKNPTGWLREKRWRDRPAPTTQNNVTPFVSTGPKRTYAEIRAERLAAEAAQSDTVLLEVEGSIS